MLSLPQEEGGRKAVAKILTLIVLCLGVFLFAILQRAQALRKSGRDKITAGIKNITSGKQQIAEGKRLVRRSYLLFLFAFLLTCAFAYALLSLLRT